MSKSVKKKKVTKTERLLKFVAKKGEVTREEITRFLLGGKKGVQDYDNFGYEVQLLRGAPLRKTSPDYWKAQLFGTWRQEGLLGRFLKKTKSGTFTVNKCAPTGEPFYPVL